jgi:[ribosomal protein S18]-alanine N-acetyltransferase
VRCRTAYHYVLEVKSRNTAALGLYQKLGFVSCGIRRMYYVDGSDAVLLQRPARV